MLRTLLASRLVAGGAVAVLFATPVLAVGQQQPLEETVRVAENLLAQGDRDTALEMAEEVVARDPFNVEAHHLIQRVMRRDRNAEMLARYRELSIRYPSSAAAQYLMGNALLNSPNNPAARSAGDYFDQALRLDPGFGWAASIQAIFAQMRGETDEALRLGEASVQDIRDDLTTATTYADLMRLNGQRAEAMRFLEQAAAMHPDDPRYLLELWRLRMRGVDDYEAERAAWAWQVAANRERFLASPEYTKALASFYSGSAMADRDGSRQLWLELANRFPGDAEAKSALLNAARYTRDINERLGVFERILREYPDSPVRYQVYFRMISQLISAEELDRAKRVARGLTTEPDPGRGDAVIGRDEGHTPWGYTLQGIGYAGWFAAAQAEGRGKTPNYEYRNNYLGVVERPIHPEALTAARSMEASGCNDPSALISVAKPLLDSSYHRDLGLRLMERALEAADGKDPMIELMYGADALAEVREDMERELVDLPVYYALNGRMGIAEAMVAERLANIDSERFPQRIHPVAARVFFLAGRYRDAARQYLLAKWHSPTPSSPNTLRGRTDKLMFEHLEQIVTEVGGTAIERFSPGAGPRIPPMAMGLQPVAGAASLDATALGGDLLLLVFYSRWNESSMSHLRALDALTLEYVDDPRVSTLGVGLERLSNFRTREGGPIDQFDATRRSENLTLPLARAEKEVIDRADLLGLSTTLLIDRTGRVLARQMGHGVERGLWSEEWRAVLADELQRIEARQQR